MVLTGRATSAAGGALREQLLPARTQINEAAMQRPRVLRGDILCFMK
jgi:hypothetical protein